MGVSNCITTPDAHPQEEQKSTAAKRPQPKKSLEEVFLKWTFNSKYYRIEFGTE
jgi:hypothetical protein